VLLAQPANEKGAAKLWSAVMEANIGLVAVISDASAAYFPQAGSESTFGETHIAAKASSSKKINLTLARGSMATTMTLMAAPGWLQKGGAAFAAELALARVTSAPVAVVFPQGEAMNAAILVACLTAAAQLRSDGRVDVFSVVRAHHRARPGLWHSVGDFLKLYKVVEAMTPAVISGQT